MSGKGGRLSDWPVRPITTRKSRENHGSHARDPSDAANDPPMTTQILSPAAVREHFPALASCPDVLPDVLLDNAGGSQVPESVARAIADYMRSTYVQLGADYATSRRCTELVARAHAMVRCLMNADGVGEVIFGSSTSALVTMLADCYARAGAGTRDQIIVAQTNHESNAGPWLRLKERGFRTDLWQFDNDAGVCPLDTLQDLLSDRTRIVAVPHVSNLLGGIEDIQAVTRMAHDAGARVVVDGVAFAPHRAIDVQAWGVDWYAYSTYKVYGPHMAALFGTHEAIDELLRPSHDFLARDDVPYAFEIGGANHESCAAVLGLWPYLRVLASENGEDNEPAEFDRSTVDRAFETMIELELPLQRRVINYLRSRGDITIIGPDNAGATRVPTISFVRKGQSSREIAERVCAKGLGIRFGHFYSRRLCQALGLDPADGVVRASMVHYNTTEEINRLIEALEEIMQ